MLAALQVTCEQQRCPWKGRNDRYEAHKNDECLPQEIIKLKALVLDKARESSMLQVWGREGAARERNLCGAIRKRDGIVAGLRAIIEEKDATITTLRNDVGAHLARRRMRYFIDQMPPEEILREARRMGLTHAGCPARFETPPSPEVRDVSSSPSRTRSRSPAPIRSTGSNIDHH